LKQSNWIEDLVFPLAVAVLTAAWVRLWVLWVARAGLPDVSYPPVSPVLLGLLLVGAALLSRAALERTGELGPARLLIVGVGLAGISASLWWTFRFESLGAFMAALGDWGRYISPVLFGLLACAFMWWQGITLAVANWPQQYLERSFYVGIAGLALLFVVNQSNPQITPGEAVATAVALFSAGLGALSLVSFENARRYHEGTTGTRLALNRYWAITVASVIGAILAAGLVAATLFSPGVYAGIGLALRALMDVVTFAVVFVLAAFVAIMIAVIFPIMAYLLRFQPGIPDEFIEMTPAEAAGGIAQDAVQVFAENPALAAGRQVLFVVLLAVGVGLILWWSVRKLGRVNRRDSDEVRDSIATRELVWSQLKAFLNRRAGSSEAVDPYLALAGSADDPRLIVRRAYQAMLEWARTVTQSRAAGQTPATYAEALARARPQARAAIHTLTGAYERARYADEPPSLAEARSAEGALSELRALSDPTGNGNKR
jgi:hypothetical protein